MESVFPAEPLTRDTPCIHCGYNLRGLVPGGMCPECGHAIDESLRGDLLRFANPNWLRRVRLGVRLQLWVIGLDFVLSAVSNAQVIGLSIKPNEFQVARWAPILLAIWGALTLTTREPRGTVEHEGVSARTFLRAATYLLPVFQVMHISADLLPQTVVLVVIAVRTFHWPLQYAMFLIFLRRFALRVPDEELFRSSTRLIYVGSVCYGLVLPFVVHLYIRIHSGLTPTFPGEAFLGPTGLKAISSAVMCILPILFLWYVRLLNKYRKVLAEQVRLAEAA